LSDLDVGSIQQADGLFDWMAETLGVPDVRPILAATQETITIHLWTRIPNHDRPLDRRHRDLAMTVCSDRVWFTPSAVDVRRITIPTKRLAIDAFTKGYLLVRNTGTRDYQWNFVAANPVRIHERPGRAPFIAAVLSLQSTLPWTYQEQSGVFDGAQLVEFWPDGEVPVGSEGRRIPLFERFRGGKAPVTLLRLCRTRTKAGDNRGALDKYLSLLSKAAVPLLDVASSDETDAQ
jgi:hypothetical protein